MRQNRMFFVTMVLSGLIAIGVSGCTVIFQKGRSADVERISKLKSDLTELERAKQELESRLKNEINDKEVKVEMLAKGLVITFVAEVLFYSGKAQLRKGSFPKLDKVAGEIGRA